ncbi:baseplate J/gp47 family protein [Brevibacillus borstelensis]|uniref:baseplate J/gp47 family protein n=1 Tax=Brevibacillus borstelensis TaxID=45462 RepID=UPI0030C51E60
MYENQTFQVILQRMLDRVKSQRDKREGSVIYDTVSPVAAKLSQLYMNLDVNLNLVFADTATGIYLDYLADTLGIAPRKPATKAVWKGVFTDNSGNPFDVPIGSRYSIENLNYTATEKIATGQFKVECETAGEIGNSLSGSLVPIEYIPGLKTAQLTEILTPGEEQESDESLRSRYIKRAREPITSGNAHQYEMWALEVSGIGGAKAYEVWNGPGTVKVVVLDDNMRAPTPAKVAEVDTYIKSVMPVNVDLTVSAATELPINITATLTLQPGTTTSYVSAQVQASLIAYLKSVALKESLIRVSRVANLILDVEGVIDYANLKLNGNTGNVTVPNGSVAVAGTVNFT